MNIAGYSINGKEKVRSSACVSVCSFHRAAPTEAAWKRRHNAKPLRNTPSHNDETPSSLGCEKQRIGSVCDGIQLIVHKEHFFFDGRARHSGHSLQFEKDASRFAAVGVIR